MIGSRWTVVSVVLAIGLFATRARAQAPASEPAAPTAKIASDGKVIKGKRGWVADGRAGAPILESGAFKFVASGMLGYRWKKLEIIASGNINQWVVDGLPDQVSTSLVFPACTDTGDLHVGRDGPVVNDSNIAVDELALYASALPAARFAAHYAAR